MSILNKVVSFLFGCCLVITGVIVFTDGLGLTHVATALSMYFAGGIVNTPTLIIGGVLFLVGLIIVLANLCIKAPKAVKVPGSPKNNAVYVTLNTIENMAKTTALAVPGVVGVSTKIKNSGSGICLRMKINVTSDDKITAVTQQLQDDIKILIEGSTSLPVKAVQVLVVKAAVEKDAQSYRNEVQAQGSREVTTPLRQDGEE